MSEAMVYLNGEYLPISQAKVSVMDRGFLLADGIYDVIPTYYSKLFYADEHLVRLFANLKIAKIKQPFNKQTFLDIFSHLIDINPSSEVQGIYIQITRGEYLKRVSYAPCEKPTTFIMLQPKSERIDDAIKPVSVVTVKDIRWSLCSIKGVNRFSNTLMSMDVYQANVHEGLIVSNAKVREGISSNVFIVEDGNVITPPLSDNILNGVTRQAIIDIVKQEMDLSEQSISLERLLSAEEVWITSSLRGVVPVVEVDGKKIQQGIMGDKVRLIHKKYIALIKALNSASRP